LSVLHDTEERDHLDQLQQDQIANDVTYQHVRELGHRFQNALDEIFFNEDKSPILSRLTRAYGVF
jgi:hypothetical protein